MPLEIVSHGVTEALVRLDARIARLADLTPELDEATNVVYEATRSWYDSRGNGSWPPLAESTIAAKTSQGYADPERPLYAEGNLYESATSPTGPYSFKLHPGINDVAIGVDWALGGWQIPVVHYYGTDSAGVNRNVRIPARRIWPDHDSHQYAEMRRKISELLLRGL